MIGRIFNSLLTTYPRAGKLWGKWLPGRAGIYQSKITNMIFRYRDCRSASSRRATAREVTDIPKGGRKFLPLALIAAFLQVIAFWPSTAARAEGEDSAFHQVGILERFPKDARDLPGFGAAAVPNLPLTAEQESQGGRVGTLIPIPDLRQLWQLWQPTAGSPTFVVVRDLDSDSLKITNWFTLPMPIRRGGFAGAAGEWMHAIDAEGKRLFVLGFGAGEAIGGYLLVLDLTFSRPPKSLKINFTPGDRSYQPTQPNGISWDPISRRIWATWGKQANPLDPYSVNFLVRMNPDGGNGFEAIDGSPKLLRGCKGPLPGGFQASSQWYSSKILRSKDGYLHIPCHREIANAAVAILKADKALDPEETEELAVGPASEALFVLADDEGGRLHFVLTDNQDWVWDVESKAFVGFVNLGQSTIVGLDQEFGRLYVNSGRFGLGFTETRYMPVGQARFFSDSAGPGPGLVEIISVDPRSQRIFTLSHGQNRVNTSYRIFKVPSPAPPQSKPNPDQNTVDIPEQTGLTTADFTGSAGGYGIRVLAAGGFTKAIPMPVIGSLSTSLVFKAVNSKCGYTDREMAAGDVADAKMTTRSARAVAFGFFLDYQSQQNLRVPSQCDVESPGSEPFNGVFGTYPFVTSTVGDNLNSTLSQEWSPAFASCSLPGSDPTSTVGDPPSGRALVSCPPDPEVFGQTLTAWPFSENALTADALGTVEGPQLSGTGYSKITLYRDRARGLVSRAESIARGLTFGIVDPSGKVDPNLRASIDEIRSVAESWSKGRPGIAKSSRTVTVTGFVGSDGTSCVTCDIKAVIDALNTAFVGRAYFQRPAHDKDLFDGTDKGAQSAVQKSDAQVASDRATRGDSRAEVPALEIITYNDTPTWGRARQIYQLAGVKTASTYNISKLSSGDGFGPNDDFFDEGDPNSEDFSDAAFSDDSGAPLALLGAGCDNSFGGRIARLAGILWRNLKNAAAMGTVWLLFLSPLLIAGRRRLLRGIFPAASLGGTGVLTMGRMSPQAKKLALVILALLMAGLVFSLTSRNDIAGASEITSPVLAADCFSADGLAGVAKMLWRGIKEALGMATVWLLFLSPLLIAGRRRLLRTTSIPS